MILNNKALIVGLVVAGLILRKKPLVEVNINVYGREENTGHNEN